MHPDFGPLTPFVRAIDGMKAYDPGAKYIAAGGVTSSLIIPGSANIMGGEGTPVKNIPRSGPHHEYVVEDLLLEHGVPLEERLRYMKMACGENPKRVYGHTRMGNAWIFREQLSRAKELLEKQDAWCEAAVGMSSEGEKRAFIEAMGSFPVELKLDSTVGMLRGRVALHNHCYEPEDFETMLRISHEFGFRVRAFHHAISAWLVPEMLKEYGDNVTIATFAEYGLYKREAYQSSLHAGKILSDHGVPVAYKSDHFGEDSNARWLLLQAAVGHSFHLPAEKALQAVTSVPAAAIDLDYRIGYLRPGYDADIVVWDAHPLSIGATPRQVYIDGIATLDPVKVEESAPRTAQRSSHSERGVAKPAMRAEVSQAERQDICEKATTPGRQFIISGIKKSFLDNYPEVTVKGDHDDGDLTLVIADGAVTCLSYGAGCAQTASQVTEDATLINLTNGYLSPGLTAVTTSLGLLEVAMESATGDGVSIPMTNVRDPSNVNYAKYGVSIEGKGIARARVGGVTRAITPPFTFAGLVRGVSTGFRTGNDSNLLNGGIFQPDVALHINLGEEAKAIEGTESRAIYELRQLLTTYSTKEDNSAYASVVKGNLPLVIHAQSVV
ncbi:putative carbohydrate esterase family 9 protein [Phaeoacremonium minimum UCRPA7]|uniref:Putative carbohydrate esterase family 9 protein n=1 Tax=Phaeoacremonium minimum (strain UCR-PA7) TaxID=1286976 RepID=R8BFI2_PHAM7|nr:putative carbohydrate esterase family 9 protein [Phaeoacremonium minimum UCRPA7]EON98044.1 putative carbohydrate esterase family 9 protein [Phaeoacremonium minimum UCRPA7]